MLSLRLSQYPRLSFFIISCQSSLLYASSFRGFSSFLWTSSSWNQFQLCLVHSIHQLCVYFSFFNTRFSWPLISCRQLFMWHRFLVFRAYGTNSLEPFVLLFHIHTQPHLFLSLIFHIFLYRPQFPLNFAWEYLTFFSPSIFSFLLTSFAFILFPFFTAPLNPESSTRTCTDHRVWQRI